MVEFTKVLIPEELEALCAFDRRAFHAYPGDLYDLEVWRTLESYWMVVDGETVGCSAFRFHVDHDGSERPGTLDLSSTGVLPEYQGRGYGLMQKKWQIEFAKQQGFQRIVTCMRESNERIIRLNKKLRFQPAGIEPHYYHDPDEAALVMELVLENNLETAPSSIDAQVTKG